MNTNSSNQYLLQLPTSPNAPVNLVELGLQLFLLAIRQKLGMEDARLEMEECKLCDNSDFRPGVSCAIPDTPETGKTGSVDPEAEALIKEITAQILQQLKK